MGLKVMTASPTFNWGAASIDYTGCITRCGPCQRADDPDPVLTGVVAGTYGFLHGSECFWPDQPPADDIQRAALDLIRHRLNC